MHDMESPILALDKQSEDDQEVPFDLIEKQYHDTLKSVQNTWDQWEKESKEFEEMSKKLLVFFLNVEPKVFIPPEVVRMVQSYKSAKPTDEKDLSCAPSICIASEEKVAIAKSFGAQTSFSLLSETSSSSEAQKSTPLKDVLITLEDISSTITEDFEITSTKKHKPRTPLTEMTPLDNLTTPATFLEGMESRTGRNSQAFCNRSDNMTETPLRSIVKTSTNKLHPKLVDYDITTVPLVDYDITTVPLVDYDITTVPLVDYDITAASTLVDRDMSTVPLVDYDTTNQSLRDYNSTRITTTPRITKSESPPNSGIKLVDYDITKVPLVNYDDTSTFNQCENSMTDSHDSSRLTNYDITRKIYSEKENVTFEPNQCDNLVQYDSTAMSSKLELSDAASVVERESLIGLNTPRDESVSPMRGVVSVKDHNATLTKPSIDLINTNSISVKTPSEDVSALGNSSESSSINEMSPFFNPNFTGRNSLDVRKAYERAMDEELDFVNPNESCGPNLYNLRRRYKKPLSKTTAPSKKITIDIEIVDDNNDVLEEVMSTSTPPISVGSVSPTHQQPIDISISVDFDVHSFKELSVAGIEESSAPVNLGPFISPQKRAIQRSHANEELVSPAKIARLQHSTKEGKPLIEQENPPDTATNPSDVTILPKLKPVTQTKTTQKKKSRKRNRVPLTMPNNKKIRKGDYKYTFQSYSKARVYQNSPSSRTLRQLQRATPANLLSSAKKVAVKLNNRRMHRKSTSKSLNNSVRQPILVSSPTQPDTTATMSTFSPPKVDGGSPSNSLAECSSCSAELPTPKNSPPHFSPFVNILCANCICALKKDTTSAGDVTTLLKTTLLKANANPNGRLKRRGKLNLNSSLVTAEGKTTRRSSFEQQVSENIGVDLQEAPSRRTLRKRKVTTYFESKLALKPTTLSNETGERTIRKTKQVSGKTKLYKGSSENVPLDEKHVKCAPKKTTKQKSILKGSDSTSEKYSNDSITKTTTRRGKARVGHRGNTRSNRRGNSRSNRRSSIVTANSFVQTLPVLEEVNEDQSAMKIENDDEECTEVDSKTTHNTKKGKRRRSASYRSARKLPKQKSPKSEHVKSSRLDKKNVVKTSGCSNSSSESDNEVVLNLPKGYEDFNSKARRIARKSSGVPPTPDPPKSEHVKSSRLDKKNVVKTSGCSNSSSESDNEVVLNLPKGYEDFNSKARRIARKSPGVPPTPDTSSNNINTTTTTTTTTNNNNNSNNNKENNAASGTNETDTFSSSNNRNNNRESNMESDISENDTVIQNDNVYTPPRTRVLRSIRCPTRPNAIVDHSVVSSSKKNEKNLLPKPFAVPAPPSKKAPAKVPSKKNVVPPRTKRQTTKATRSSTLLCDASQLTDESSVVNKSKTLFKSKNNTLKTPDSNDKHHPMNSTLVNDNLQNIKTFNARHRGAGPELSVIGGRQTSRLSNNSSRASSSYSRMQNVVYGIPEGLTNIIAQMNNVGAKK